MAEAFQNLIGKPLATPPSRISFPSLVAPDTGRQYSDDKYKITQLFDKKNTEFKELKDACLEIAKEAWGNNVQLKELDLLPFKNGDERSNWQGYEGQVFIVSKSKFPVQCFGPKKVDGALPVIPAKDIYAGCIARAILVPMAYMRGSDRGVTFLLNSVQFLDDAPRFGGLSATDAADLFGEAPPKVTAVVSYDLPQEVKAAEPQPAATRGRGRPPKAVTEPVDSGNGADTDDDALPLSGAAKKKPAEGKSLLDMI